MGVFIAIVQILDSTIRLSVPLLLACLAVTARTGAMQGPPTQAPANAPTTTATVPPNPGAFSNAPREPQRLSSEQQAQHSMLTDREQLLSYAILLFGTAVTLF